MKVLDVYPKDVHVKIEIPLRELKMLRNYIKNSMPFYNKVVEDYGERTFLEESFLPDISDAIEYTDKLKV